MPSYARDPSPRVLTPPSHWLARVLPASAGSPTSVIAVPHLPLTALVLTSAGQAVLLTWRDQGPAATLVRPAVQAQALAAPSLASAASWDGETLWLGSDTGALVALEATPAPALHIVARSHGPPAAAMVAVAPRTLAVFGQFADGAVLTVRGRRAPTLSLPPLTWTLVCVGAWDCRPRTRERPS